MAKTKSNKKKWTKGDIVGAVIFSLFAGFALWLLVYVLGGVVINGNNPFDKGLCNYRAFSEAGYPVNNTPLDVYKEYLYFDSYGVNGGVVTVHAYWYVDGIFWKRCDGDLKFTTTDAFIPILREEHKITILEQSCPEKNK